MKNYTKNISFAICSFLFFLTHTNNAMENQSIDTIVYINYEPLPAKNFLLTILKEEKHANNLQISKEEDLLNFILDQKLTKRSILSESISLEMIIEERKKRCFNEIESDQTLPLSSSKKQCLEKPSTNYNAAPINFKPVTTIHTKNNFNKKHYICRYDGCGKSFTQQGNLTTHERIHTGEKPYKCSYNNCDKSFAQKGNLTKHEKNHSNKKPYTCTLDGCDKSFTCKSSLTRHKKTHSNEKPYKCTLDGCDKSFTDKSNLTKHEKTHSSERPYKCTHPDCGKSFICKSGLTRHLTTH